MNQGINTSIPDRRLFLAACAVATLVATLAWGSGAFLLGLGVVAAAEPLAAVARRRGRPRPVRRALAPGALR
jgi:hypothetical protein